MATPERSSLSFSLKLSALRLAVAAVVGQIVWQSTGDANLSLTAVSIALAAVPTPGEFMCCGGAGCRKHKA